MADRATLEFFVSGLPAPGGSKKGYVIGGRAVITDACSRSKPWRAVVALAGQNAMAGRSIFIGPLLLTLCFQLPRPRSHFGSGKNADELRKSAPPFPCGRPDLTKLVRSTEDALTNVCWFDDSQIVSQLVIKRYSEIPGVRITVEEADSESVARGLI